MFLSKTQIKTLKFLSDGKVYPASEIGYAVINFSRNPNTIRPKGSAFAISGTLVSLERKGFVETSKKPFGWKLTPYGYEYVNKIMEKK